MELAGQILGWVSALLMCLSYQCKEHKKLLVAQTASTICICVSYCLLGAWSGMLLNIVCILRNLIIYKKDIKIFSYPFWPYVLAGVMVVVGALSWQGPMSLLMIVALGVNTVFIAFPNVQNLRKSILVTSTMVMAYNIYYSVWGGVMNELISIISAVIGLYRFKKK